MQILLMFELLDQNLPELKHFIIIIKYKIPKNTQVQIFIKIGP